jgi:hypothetical protein
MLHEEGGLNSPTDLMCWNGEGGKDKQEPPHDCMQEGWSWMCFHIKEVSLPEVRHTSDTRASSHLQQVTL